MKRRRFIQAAAAVPVVASVFPLLTTAAGRVRHPLPIPPWVDMVVFHSDGKVELVCAGIPGPAREDWLRWDPDSRTYDAGNGMHVSAEAMERAVEAGVRMDAWPVDRPEWTPAQYTKWLPGPGKEE